MMTRAHTTAHINIGVGKSRSMEKRTNPAYRPTLRAAAFSDLLNHAVGDVRPRMLDGELYRHGDSFHDFMTAVHAGDPTLDYQHLYAIPRRYDILARTLERWTQLCGSTRLLERRWRHISKKLWAMGMKVLCYTHLKACTSRLNTSAS